MKATQEEQLFTAGAIATALGAPGARVKKAIQDLGIEPKARKGACSYYGKDALEKVRKAVAK